MKLLNLDSGDEAATPNKKKSKWLKIGIGLSALVLIPTIGSTLAGSISINAGSGVEFGQGVVSTAACDNEITVAPSSGLQNAFPTAWSGSTPDTVPPSLPYFRASSIRVSGIDGLACADKNFRLTAYDALGAVVPLCDGIPWYPTDTEATDYVDIYFGVTGNYIIASSCGDITSSDKDAGHTGVGYFVWESGDEFQYLDSGNFVTITLESSSTPCYFDLCLD